MITEKNRIISKLFHGLVVVILLAGCPYDPDPDPDPTDEDVTLTREHLSAFTPGETMDITVEIEVGRAVHISAIALVETAPPGWTYLGSIDDGAGLPSIRPLEGEGGELTFVWIQTPRFPYAFTYTLQVPEIAVGPATLSGHAEYREGDGGAHQSETLVSTIVPAKS